jgi:CHASE3 domain sensor protein
MESADKDSVRLGAATYIIDRGWGKAVQVVEDRNGNPLANAATELLMAMRERLTQTVEERKHLVHVHDR